MPTPSAGLPWSFAVPDASDESPIERIAGLFARHDVEFIVIGGQAEALHGSARVTFDVDLCYRRSAENLDRLAGALRELKPPPRLAPTLMIPAGGLAGDPDGDGLVGTATSSTSSDATGCRRCRRR